MTGSNSLWDNGPLPGIPALTVARGSKLRSRRSPPGYGVPIGLASQVESTGIP